MPCRPAKMFCVAIALLYFVGFVQTRRGPMYQIDDNLMMMRCHMRHCRTPQDDVSVPLYIVIIYAFNSIIYICCSAVLLNVWNARSTPPKWDNVQWLSRMPTPCKLCVLTRVMDVIFIALERKSVATINVVDRVDQLLV